MAKSTDVAGNLGAVGYSWFPVLIQRWLRRRQERRASRITLAALENLSEWKLNDIGLSRNDLMSIRSGVFFRDGSRRKR